MGSVPTQTLEIDLNGTGTLVDVTSYVDFDAGIRHSWGRTASDPFRNEPPPGSLTFALDNNDGRFTPGNTAVYTVGLVEGVLVQWTCGTRVRRFRTGVPDVAFPTQVGGRCTVEVSCLDALALLAKRQMRQMVDEVAFTVRPVAHWPLNDSGTAAVDISGNAEVELTPAGTGTEMLSWGNAIGPRTDGRGALSFQPEATTYLADSSSPCITNATALGANVSQSWVSTSSSVTTGYAVSFWFSVRDIYGGTFSTTNLWDGPYVILAKFAGTPIMWRLADRKIVVGCGSLVQPVLNMPDLPAVQPGTVNHAFLWIQNNSSTNQCLARFWLNGVETSTGLGDPSAVHGPTGAPTVYLGGAAGTVSLPDPVYGLSGSTAVATVYTYQQAADLVAAGVVPDFYSVGSAGPSEDAGARFQRFGSWLGRSGIAYAVQGTPSTSLMDAQNTEGKSMLSAMCTALALEERVIDCATLSGVETVRAWMRDQHRPVSPAITMDVQDDGVGVPALTFDASGVAETATVKGFSRTVTWTDTATPERWQGTSAQLDAATDDFDALRGLAQFRTIVGRVTTMTPSKVTVDAASSKAALTTSLLGLSPMKRIRVAGLPAGIVGFSEVDAILVGCVETHTLGRNLFELQLTPDLPYTGGRYDTARYGAGDPYSFTKGYTYTTPAAWPSPHPITGWFPVINGVLAAATWMNVRLVGAGLTPPAGTFLPNGAPPDPLYIKWDDEIIQVTNVNAPTVDQYSYGTGSYAWEANWTVDIARGQLGTTAADHLAQSGGGLGHTGLTTMGVVGTFAEPVVIWLDTNEEYGY